MPAVIIRKRHLLGVNPLAGLPREGSINPRVYDHRHRSKEFQNVAVLRKPVESVPGRTTIRQLFLDCSMANHHEGLPAIAKKRGVDPDTLKPGDFLLFMNAPGTYAKLLGAGNTIVSIKAPRGKIAPLLISRLPEIFCGQQFDYDAALRPILEAHLAEKAKTRARRKKAEVGQNT